VSETVIALATDVLKLFHFVVSDAVMFFAKEELKAGSFSTNPPFLCR